MMKKLIIFSFILGLLSCNPQPDIDNETMLDGDKIFDLSLYQPQDYLISKKYPAPTELQKNTPVIIAAHGYSATTFEWDELHEFALQKGNFMVSRVLLGGHGRDFASFKAATWEDWQASIKTEYDALVALGYKKIWLIGSSTGAPLIVNMIKTGFFEDKTTPKGFFLIDPIVISTNKTLTMVGLLGPVLGYTTTELDPGETGKWYVYRPQESLKQLMQLIDLTRKDLEKGISLPTNAFLRIYKSKIDYTADPASAALLYNGLEKSDGKPVEVTMMQSSLHVFTRLRGRLDVTPVDQQNQQKAFNEIANEITQ